MSSAFDRLQSYRAKEGLHPENKEENKNCPLDVTTPQGAFLKLIHNKGYKVYKVSGMKSDGTPDYEYTEL